MNSILAELHDSSKVLPLSSPSEHTKALCVHWNTEEDALHVATPQLDVGHPPSKCAVASAAAQIFNLLGYFSPATIPVRIQLQELWGGKNLKWDSVIPDELHKR